MIFHARETNEDKPKKGGARGDREKKTKKNVAVFFSMEEARDFVLLSHANRSWSRGSTFEEEEERGEKRREKTSSSLTLSQRK